MLNEQENIFSQKQMEIDNLQSQIRCLQADLSADTSSTGDWKIIKIYQARMQGLPDPYDFEQIVAARQAKRDQINALQQKIKALL